MNGKYDVMYLHDRLSQDQPNANNDQMICFIQHRNLTTKSLKEIIQEGFENDSREILDYTSDLFFKPESYIDLPNNFMLSENHFTGFEPGLIIDLKSNIRACKILKEPSSISMKIPSSISMKIIKDRKRNK